MIISIVCPCLVTSARENAPRLLMAWPTLLRPTHPSSPHKSSSFLRRFHTIRFHARTSCLPPQPTLHPRLLLPSHLPLPQCAPHLHETNRPPWNLHVSGPGLMSAPNSDERLGLTAIGLRPKTLVTNAKPSSLTWRGAWQSSRKRITDCERAWVSPNLSLLIATPSAPRQNRYRPARTESSRKGSRV